MKRTACMIIVLCLLLGGCGFSALQQNAPAPPSASADITPSPSPSPSPTDSEDDDSDIVIDPYWVYSELANYYKDQITAADAFKVTIGDTVYYFDTGKFVQMDYGIEFPLYRKVGDKDPEYLGTTGYEFHVNGQYIYVKSDMEDDESPVMEMTRVIDLSDLSITSAGRDIDIFIPGSGNRVYYTKEVANSDDIYSADSSLKGSREFHISIPDRSKIEQAIQLSISDINVDIVITDVKDGWIYFSYDVFDLQGPNYYKGNYRVPVSGGRVEKTDTGSYSGDTAAPEDTTSPTTGTAEGGD